MFFKERPSPDHAEDPQTVFDRALDVIHTALVSYYKLTDKEARGAEEDLLDWFRRLAKRAGGGPSPLRLLRVSLLSAACQYGRSFQLWKLGNAKSSDESLNRLLAQEPDIVAAELERRLDEERS